MLKVHSPTQLTPQPSWPINLSRRWTISLSLGFFLLWLSTSVLIICIRSCLPNSIVNVDHSHVREEVGESLSPLYISSLPRGPLTFGACLMPFPCLLSITGTRLKSTANGHFTKDFWDHPSISSVKHTSSINKHMQTRLSRYSTPSRILCKEEALQSGGIWGDTTGIDSSLRTFYPFFKKEDVMPVSKNKPTTLSPEGSTSESASNTIRLAGRNFASIYGVWP